MPSPLNPGLNKKPIKLKGGNECERWVAVHCNSALKRILQRVIKAPTFPTNSHSLTRLITDN